MIPSDPEFPNLSLLVAIRDRERNGGSDSPDVVVGRNPRQRFDHVERTSTTLLFRLYHPYPSDKFISSKEPLVPDIEPFFFKRQTVWKKSALSMPQTGKISPPSSNQLSKYTPRVYPRTKMPSSLLPQPQNHTVPILGKS